MYVENHITEQPNALCTVKERRRSRIVYSGPRRRNVARKAWHAAAGLESLAFLLPVLPPSFIILTTPSLFPHPFLFPSDLSSISPLLLSGIPRSLGAL